MRLGHFGRRAGLILAVALAVRVGWLVAHLHLPLENDPADYERLAVSIAHGHGFGTTVVAPGGGPTAFRPPLWPLFLGALYWVVGVHPLVARSVEVVLGTGTVALIGVLARQLWPRRPGAAPVAMGLAAVYPPLLLAGGSLLSESLSLPLELGSLSAALAARRSAHPSWWRAACGGLCGLDILCRPDSFLLLLPVVLLLPSPSGWWRRVGAAAVVVLVAGLTVTPWLVRDAVVMGRFIPVTTQGGLVASGTYNDTAAHDRTFPAEWRPASIVPEYVPLLQGTEVQEESALRHAALHYIRRHPSYVLRVCWWNTLRLFDLTGLTDPRISWGANGYGPAWAGLDAVGLAGLAALVVTGAAVGTVRRRNDRRGAMVWFGRDTWPVWLAPVLVAAVTVPVLGESRLRVGIDPFLILLAVPGSWVVGETLSAMAHRRGAAQSPSRGAAQSVGRGAAQ